MRLKEKVAIITGGAHGIGKTLVMAFAKEGAKLVVADINLEETEVTVDTLRKEGFEALAVRTDVSSPESTEEMARKTIENFGRIDILVNNAGIFGKVTYPAVPFYKLDLAEWDKILSVNLTGAFLCSRAIVPHMKNQGGGKIINMGSVTFFWGASPALPVPYVVSKGGIIGLTRALARELGDYNINVNCIAPGSTLSEEPTNQVALKNRKLAIPVRAIKHMEHPEDIRGTAIFLASSDSDFITGQTIVVDGGYIMH
ncbi:SDR family NAD(P)-dependent oxidoreductase [Chloroflexota bacterium]